ncbi:MAG: PQ-loop domain-containing transporter [Acidimicrobiia bacterium]|nr:PQ-loop domain-containing transporter [Acidimicrobiia bacterium]
MTELSANIAVIAATIGTVTFLIPQIVKLIRTKDSAGVSTTWPALGFVTNIGWFVYVISQSLWAAMVAPFVTFLSYGMTLWALARTGRGLRVSAVRGVAWAVLLVSTAAALGWEALGVVLGLSYGVMLAPSVWTAYRTVDPSGISPGTWWIGTAEAVLWGYYGVFHADAGIITFGIVGLLGSSLMLIRFYTTRPHAPAPMEEPAR